MVILHDARMATDLLEKRSSIYSSRPRLVFAGEIIGWNDVLALQPYNKRFRAYRKALHQVLGTKTLVGNFNSLQELEARRFLQRVLENPKDLVQHIRTEAGAIILQIAYGYTINPDGHDPLVKMANDAMESFSAAASPGMCRISGSHFPTHTHQQYYDTDTKRNRSFTHNPTTYPEPERFHPARFLGATPQPDPAEVVFGFGRRICPGRVLADSSIFVTVAMALAVFKISPGEGMEGKLGKEFTPGVVSQPVLPRGGVRVVARSPQHEEVVRDRF